MTTSCLDVCNAVISRLAVLEFPISTADEDHDDVLHALGRVEFVRRQATPAVAPNARVVIEVRGGVADVAAPCGADECSDGIEVIIIDHDNECCPQCQSNDFRLDSGDSGCSSATSRRICGACGATWDVDRSAPTEPHAVRSKADRNNPRCPVCGSADVAPNDGTLQCQTCGCWW